MDSVAEDLVRRATRVAMTGLVDHPDAHHLPIGTSVRVLAEAGWVVDPELAQQMMAIATQRAFLEAECVRLHRELAKLQETPACDRCGCTDEMACEGGCAWVPNSRFLDLCSSCITPDGRCTTPHCGTYSREDTAPFGWILVDVAGSTQPVRWHCSPWCATAAMTAMGAEIAAADMAAAAGGDLS
ncbi:hypothetical protein AB0903_09210 [Streptomyces sp. NPDC048389]|uniref:hypothetical protein n=1 Tax=Streptomyces sp. NPDC048389 TaxID=3154622 RepID=UPI00345659B9